MSFKDVIGQEKAIQILRNIINNKRINHAYLFTGKEGVGKKTLAFEFAKALNCQHVEGDSCNNCIVCKKIDHFNHPDVRFVDFEEESNLIKIEQIRELQRDISYKPYESQWKIYIIDHAEWMTQEAANSLLKTLEEPPVYSIIILLAEETDKILTTVISRCQKINLGDISREKLKEYLLKNSSERERVELISRLANGSMGRAIELLNNNEFLNIRQELFNFLLDLPSTDTLNIFNNVNKLVDLLNSGFPLFDLLISWYHDIIIYKHRNSDELINYDYQQGIKSQFKIYTIEELISIIRLLNNISFYINHNVRKDLALQVMLLKIRAKRV
jgi:DNA polymerase III subunit delta'